MAEHAIRDAVDKAIEKTKDGKSQKPELSEIYKELQQEKLKDPQKYQTDLKEANTELTKHGFPALTIEDNSSPQRKLDFISTTNPELFKTYDSKSAGAAGGEAVSSVSDSTNPRPVSEPLKTLPAEQFSPSALRLFDKINTTGDLVLTDEELGAALQSHEFSTADMQVITALYANREALSAQNDSDATGGITMNDLMRFAEIEKANQTNAASEEDRKLISDVVNTMGRVVAQEKKTNMQLFGDVHNPLESIKADAVKQQSIGDCYFDAGLAGLAATNPQQIYDMIKANDDGTYTVTFPGAKDEPITVSGPTYGELALYNSGSKYGVWANVMEKAYGKYCSESVLRRHPSNFGGGNTPTEGADGGSCTYSANRLLTGRDSTDTDMLVFTSQSRTAQKLTEAFSSTPPKLVSAGINRSPFSDNTVDGFPNGHDYSVLGFTPDEKGGGMVKVRNPWGGADNTTSGTIEVPLDVFMRNFSVVSYT